MKSARLLTIFAIASLAICFVPTAGAASFTLNVDFCSNPCLGGVAANNNGGTVTLTENGTGTTETVTVDVELAAGLDFHQTTGLDAFLFNLIGAPAGTISFANVTSGFLTPVLSGTQEDGAGKFTYQVSYNCQPCTDGSSLKFTIGDSGGGITALMLENIGTANVDFAANVTTSGANACTGLIGAGNGTAQSTPATTHSGTGTACAGATPEASSIAFFGTGLLVAGWVLRRKLVTMW